MSQKQQFFFDKTYLLPMRRFLLLMPLPEALLPETVERYGCNKNAIPNLQNSNERVKKFLYGDFRRNFNIVSFCHF